VAWFQLGRFGLAIGLAAAKCLWLGLALANWLGYLAWLQLSSFGWLCYRLCLNRRRLVLAINGYSLAPLGYWLCLAWSRLGLVINPLWFGYGRLATGCAWLGAAWAWLLIRLGLAMAAWAWLWLCLAWCRLAMAALAWRRLAIGCAWLGAAWLLAALGLAPIGLGY
jgi:hypothetical protein